MSAVVGRGRFAGGGALARIVHTGEVLLADVAVGRVDGTTKLGRASEALLRIRWVVLGVAVGTGNHNMESTSPLSLVDGSFSGDTRAPKGAFDVGERGWVGARLGRSKSRVALKVDIEGRAKIGGIAQLLAFDGVICLEGVETHVGVGVDRGTEVYERPLVALRSGSVCGGILKRDIISRLSCMRGLLG